MEQIIRYSDSAEDQIPQFGSHRIGMLGHLEFQENLPHRTGIHSLDDHLTGINIQLNPLLDGLHGHMPTFQVPLNIFDNPALIERFKAMRCGPFLLRDLLPLKLHLLLQSIKSGLHMGEEGRVMEGVVLLD